VIRLYSITFTDLVSDSSLWKHISWYFCASLHAFLCTNSCCHCVCYCYPFLFKQSLLLELLHVRSCFLVSLVHPKCICGRSFTQNPTGGAYSAPRPPRWSQIPITPCKWFHFKEKVKKTLVYTTTKLTALFKTPLAKSGYIKWLPGHIAVVGCSFTY